MNRLALMTWAALSLATWALPAAAENAAKVHLTAFKVTSVQAGPTSREKLESLQGLRPGDTIEYRAVYVNTTWEALMGTTFACVQYNSHCYS